MNNIEVHQFFEFDFGVLQAPDDILKNARKIFSGVDLGNEPFHAFELLIVVRALQRLLDFEDLASDTIHLNKL